MNGFWQSLSFPWRICLEEAWSAYCAGSVPIGAAVCSPEGALLSRGRNRTNEAPSHGVVSGSPLAHAEVNALLSLDLNRLDPHPLILYTTTEPCPLCLGALYMAGLRTCYYAARDPYGGSANLLGKTPYLSRKPVRIIGPESPVLELAIMALFVASAVRFASWRVDPVFVEMRQVVPASIEIGAHLAGSGILLRLREDNCPAEHVWCELANLVTQWSPQPQ